MTSIKTARFMVVFLGCIVVSGRTCIAGTWIDDFSDKTLRDWGGGQMDDVVSVAVVDGHFNYRGKNKMLNIERKIGDLVESKISRLI